MKNILKTTAAVIALTAVFSGPASAMVSKSELRAEIRAVLGADSRIIVREKNGVITLSGYYSDYGDKAAAISAAKRSKGVTKVINLAFQSS